VNFCCLRLVCHVSVPAPATVPVPAPGVIRDPFSGSEYFNILKLKFRLPLPVPATETIYMAYVDVQLPVPTLIKKFCFLEVYMFVAMSAPAPVIIRDPYAIPAPVQIYAIEIKSGCGIVITIKAKVTGSNICRFLVPVPASATNHLTKISKQSPLLFLIIRVQLPVISFTSFSVLSPPIMLLIVAKTNLFLNILLKCTGMEVDNVAGPDVAQSPMQTAEATARAADAVAAAATAFARGLEARQHAMPAPATTTPQSSNQVELSQQPSNLIKQCSAAKLAERNAEILSAVLFSTWKRLPFRVSETCLIRSTLTCQHFTMGPEL
jgi:hypothetical protein